jgi:type IV secretion system protein VirB9
MNILKGRTSWIGLLAVALLLACSLSMAETTPQRGEADGRIRNAQYRPDEVYRLYGYVGYALELIFEEGETFAGNGGGDLEAITFGHFENHLILKPRAASVGTNLVIYTNRRAYRVDYSASARKPDPRIDLIMYAVQFLYPEVVKPTRPDPEEARRALEREAALRPKNLDYWYCGAPDLRPISASDDGVRTRLTFGAKAEMPAIFLSNADGTESLLNFSVENGDVLVQRVAAKFVVRRGKLTGCVVNKAYTGGGERLQSGTLASGVERDRKGAAQ